MFRIVDLEQGSDAWLSWRRSRITATMPSVIMGKSPFSTPSKLWRSICLGEEQHFYSPAAEWGKIHEEPARIYAEKHLGVKIDKGPCIETAYPKSYSFKQAASLDGCIGLRKLENGLWECDAIVEIKCPGEENFQKFKEEVPEHYWIQMQWQMLVAGCNLAYFVCFRNFEIYSHKVEFDPNFALEMIKAATKFQSYIDDFEEPALIDADYPPVKDEAAFVMLKRSKEISKLQKQLEAEDKQLKSQLIEFVKGTGNKSVSLNGVRCSISSQKPLTYRNKDIYKDYGVDLEKYKVLGESYDKISIGKVSDE